MYHDSTLLHTQDIEMISTWEMSQSAGGPGGGLAYERGRDAHRLASLCFTNGQLSGPRREMLNVQVPHAILRQHTNKELQSISRDTLYQKVW